MTNRQVLWRMLIAFIVLFPIGFFLMSSSSTNASTGKSLLLGGVFAVVGVCISSLCIWICWQFVSTLLKSEYIVSARKLVEEQSKNNPTSPEKKIFTPYSFLAVSIGLLAPMVLVGVVVLVNDFIITSFFKNSSFLNQTIFIPSIRGSGPGEDASVHLILAIILCFAEIKFLLWRWFNLFMQKIGVYE